MTITAVNCYIVAAVTDSIIIFSAFNYYIIAVIFNSIVAVVAFD